MLQIKNKLKFLFLIINNTLLIVFLIVCDFKPKLTQLKSGYVFRTLYVEINKELLK